MKICPYCIAEITNPSRDHIFNEFLGGRRCVTACYDCNNKFSHDFEARVAGNLHRLHISIASWGLKLKQNIPAWKSALRQDDLEFNLELKDGEVVPRLSKPIVEKDSRGNTIGVTYRDLDELNERLKDPKLSNRLRSVEKIQVEVPMKDVPIDYYVDKDMARLAVKMSVALASTLPEHDYVETLLGRMVIEESREPFQDVHVSFENYDDLDNLRPALSHTVYAERRDGKMIGVVQFFGVIQLVCLLGRTDPTIPDAAKVGFLDPIDHKESFAEVDPIGIQYPPAKTSAIHVQNWSEKFEKGAAERGATKKVKLSGTVEANW